MSEQDSLALSNHLTRSARNGDIAITAITTDAFERWLSDQPPFARNWVKSVAFKAAPGEVCLIPGPKGSLGSVALGVRDYDDLWSYAALPRALPTNRYRLTNRLNAEHASIPALGWGLGCYHFSRYKKPAKRYGTLVWPAGCDQRTTRALLEGMSLARDLINTPAADMGPQELSASVAALAKAHGGRSSSIVGNALLTKNYPMIHAVGRASVRAPRLAELRWGSTRHKKLTLVGKGVCFDSGGLNLKSAPNMLVMKKDMGGAATVLGLAHVVMALKLPVRLRVLIPAVENLISGDAYRPLDVIRTRKGTTVEVGDTDAEGRLVLCDALFEADSEKPDLLIDIATLTGAARMALGAELAALFSNETAAAEQLLQAGTEAGDPLWRLPLYAPYRRLLDSGVADLSNVANGPLAGAINAALFLQEFVSPGTPWIHLDTMAWNGETRPGRPAGGEASGLRALARMLIARYGA
jgi:leucyl aminopeptidase